MFFNVILDKPFTIYLYVSLFPWFIHIHAVGKKIVSKSDRNKKKSFLGERTLRFKNWCRLSGIKNKKTTAEISRFIRIWQWSMKKVVWNVLNKFSVAILFYHHSIDSTQEFLIRSDEICLLLILVIHSQENECC